MDEPQDTDEVFLKLSLSQAAKLLQQQLRSLSIIVKAAYWSLAGDACNRWYDKAINLIVWRNGWVGMSGEHSPVDAPTTGTMLNYVNRRYSTDMLVDVCYRH